MRHSRFAILLTLVTLAGCGKSDTVVDGSGRMISDKRPLAGEFQKISINVPATVVVNIGKTPASVQFTGDDNVIKLLSANIQNGSLVIDTNSHYNNHSEIRVAVEAPSVKAIDMSGAGSLDIQNIQGDSFDVSLTGACDAQAKGKVDKLSAKLTGASKLNAADLESQDAKLNVSGAGTVVVDATKSLDVDVSGAASIKYKGNPEKITKNISGAASLEELKP